MKLTKYIREEIEKGDRLKCSICGREVKVNVKGSGPLICCGKKMSNK